MTRTLRIPFALLVFSASSLLAQEGVLAPSPAQGPRPQDEPPVWAASFPEAVERARSLRDGRVFVEFTEPSCSQCERMQKLVYPSASFRGFMRDKVAVRLDRSSPDGKRLAEHFGIRAVPAWLVVTPDLLFCGKQEGPSDQATWLRRFVESEAAWAGFRQKLDAEKASPSDPAMVFEVALEAYRRGGDAMAEGRFRRVANDPKATADQREKSLGFLAAIALEARRFDDAEKALKAILATVKEPGLRERAELRLADVEIGRGERTKAAGLLRTFLDAHPESPLRPEAEALLKALGASKP